MRFKFIDYKHDLRFNSLSFRMLNEVLQSIHDQIVIAVSRFADIDNDVIIQIVKASFMQNVHFSQNQHETYNSFSRTHILYEDNVDTII